jgi:hypothetical protein
MRPLLWSAALILAIGVGCRGDDEATTSTDSLPEAVAADEVIRGTPYMGIACSSPDALSCDRVGVSVRLTEPAHRVTATLGGTQFALDDPAYSGKLRNGESRRFAGYLRPAGLRKPGSLHVLGQRRSGRDRWLDRPSKLPVTITIERKNGSTQTTSTKVWLAPGWG